MTILVGEGLDYEISRYGDEMIDIKSDSQAALPDSLTPPVYVMIGQLLGLFKSLHSVLNPIHRARPELFIEWFKE